MRCLALFVAATYALVSPAMANLTKKCHVTILLPEFEEDLPDDEEDVKNKRSACTRLINSKRIGKTTRAKAYVERALTYGEYYDGDGAFQNAFRDLEKALKLRPNWHIALIERSAIYGYLGKDIEALADANKAIASHPGKESYINRASFCLSRIEGKYKAKMYECAIADYTKLISIDAGESDHYSNRADAHKKMGKHDLAVRDYTALIRVNPKKTDSWLSWRGDAYAELGKYELAIADYTKAIDIRTRKGGYFVYLVLSDRAELYVKTKNYSRAIEDYTRLIADENDDRKTEYMDERGEVYLAMGAYDLALKDLDLVIAKNPKHSAALRNRGLVFMRKGLPERAVSDFSSAIEAHPKSGLAYRERGYAYLKVGKIERARSDFEKAKELNPKIEIDAKAVREVSHPPSQSTKDNTSVAIDDNTRNKLDLSFWESIRDSDDPAMYEAYLNKFPDGTFAALAKIKLDKLKK